MIRRPPRSTLFPYTSSSDLVTDPRVAPFHPAKMTARLQAATTSGKPILLRVDYDAGHGIGSTDRKSTRLNSSHVAISYAVFCLKKKTTNKLRQPINSTKRHS